MAASSPAPVGAALRMIQQRFREVAASTPLRALLVERPSLLQPGMRQDDLSSAWRTDCRYFAVFEYRPIRALNDQNGRPLFRDSPYFDADGKPIANTAGQPFAIDLGARRYLQLSGNFQLSERWPSNFKDWAAEAGRLASQLPKEQIARLLPSAHSILQQRPNEAGWLFLVFELGLADCLTCQPRKIAYHENRQVAFDSLPLARAQLERNPPTEMMLGWVRDLEDPPLQWFAEIPDIVQASIEAVDLLLEGCEGETAVIGAVGSAGDGNERGAGAPNGGLALEGSTKPGPVGFLGGAALADALGVDPTRRDAFFRQLERQRKSLGDDSWQEVRDPRPNSPRYLYRADSPKLRDLAAAYKTPKTG